MEYTASSAATGEESRFWLWKFERRGFTDSTGHTVFAWGCFDRDFKIGGTCSSKSRTRASALARYLWWRAKRWM